MSSEPMDVLVRARNLIFDFESVLNNEGQVNKHNVYGAWMLKAVEILREVAAEPQPIVAAGDIKIDLGTLRKFQQKLEQLEQSIDLRTGMRIVRNDTGISEPVDSGEVEHG